MRITTVAPPPPPRQVSMTFPGNEGWAIVAALRLYADSHPDAVHAADWNGWAENLDKLLRTGESNQERQPQ